jgi:hypothetical protein
VQDEVVRSDGLDNACYPIEEYTIGLTGSVLPSPSR